ncbi:MAG: lecithin retinol acyltransferase family protein [Candidatus Hydrogenedentota bacterium]
MGLIGDVIWSEHTHTAREKPPKGAIIQRRLSGGTACDVLGIVYSHMGVYVGDGKVIHLNRRGKRDTRVVLDTLETFCAGKPWRLQRRALDDSHANSIVWTAYRIMRNQNNRYNEQYSLIGQNCEHFCRECYET